AAPTISYSDATQDANEPRILRALGEGKRVALVSDAGMPLISDPGYRLVRAALAGGHAVSAVPGPSAAPRHRRGERGAGNPGVLRGAASPGRVAGRSGGAAGRSSGRGGARAHQAV